MTMMKILFVVALLSSAVFAIDSSYDFGDDFVDFPGQRYNPWSILSEETAQHAQAAGWDESTWDIIGSSGLELLAYDELTGKQLNAVEAIGFEYEAQWDCYSNHYNGYDWEDLEDLELDPYMRTLGWTSDWWKASQQNESLPVPDSFNKSWAELTEEEQLAAEAICWWPNAWDGVPLYDMDYIPIAYPTLRYTPWEELEESEQELATQVGWTQETWNSPGSDLLEEYSFDGFGFEKTAALTQLGFYEANYDCYVNHYQAYSWDKLLELGIQSHAEIGGFTADSWEELQSDLDQTYWDDLTEEQQASLYELCWFKELWNMEPLGTWEDQGEQASSSSSSSSGRKAGLGVGITAGVLVLAAMVFIFARKGRAITDYVEEEEESPENNNGIMS